MLSDNFYSTVPDTTDGIMYNNPTHNQYRVYQRVGTASHANSITYLLIIAFISIANPRDILHIDKELLKYGKLPIDNKEDF